MSGTSRGLPPELPQPASRPQDPAFSNRPIPRRLALISSQAFSIGNFRGPLVRDLVQAGVEVFALAPDYDDRQRDIVRALGAQPVDISLDRTGMNPLRDGFDMLRLAAVLRRLRVDTSFAYFIKPVIYGTLAACTAPRWRRRSASFS